MCADRDVEKSHRTPLSRSKDDEVRGSWACLPYLISECMEQGEVSRERERDFVPGEEGCDVAGDAGLTWCRNESIAGYDQRREGGTRLDAMPELGL